MIQSGLYVAGSDAEVDEAVRVWPRLDAFLAEDAPGGVGQSFSRLAEILDPKPPVGAVMPLTAGA